MIRKFALYPEERHWWSFNDYGAVLDAMRRFQPKRVVEFGPGSSTLALIEGGAQEIVTFEEDPSWADVYRERLVKKYTPIVDLQMYDPKPPLKLPKMARFDFALVDGPKGSTSRPPIIAWCLRNADVVMVPTETHHSKGIRDEIAKAAKKAGRTKVEWIETGPLSGGFAIILPEEGKA